MSIHVGRKAMISSAKDHFRAYEETSLPEFSRYMLLFYAAECLMKARLMRNNNHRTSEDSPELYYTHDLAKLAKSLRLPPHLTVPSVVKVKPVKQNITREQVTIRDVHTAWRYGCRVETQDESKLVSILAEVYGHILKMY